MPCMTPVCSSGPPERRARMRDSLGPILSSTPRISTWKSSILFPLKTVRPVPCIPALRSLSGNRAVWAALADLVPGFRQVHAPVQGNHVGAGAPDQRQEARYTSGKVNDRRLLLQIVLNAGRFQVLDQCLSMRQNVSLIVVAGEAADRQ